jgi:ribosomal protein S13
MAKNDLSITKVFIQFPLKLIMGLMIVSLTMAMPAVGFQGKNAMDPESIVSDLTTRLDLSDEQVVEIRPVIEDHAEKRRAIFDKYRAQGNQNQSAIRNEMDAVRQETHARLEKILSAVQMAEYQSYRKEQRQKMRGQGKGGCQGRMQ